MSIFLMGVWDPDAKRWCTVARCGNGHDDKTIEKLNKELKMTKISKVFRTFFDPASTFLKEPFTQFNDRALISFKGEEDGHKIQP